MRPDPRNTRARGSHRYSRLARASLGVGLVAALSACESADGPGGAEGPARGISVEEILQIRDAGAPLWSPDGGEVAFTWSHGAETNLWAVRMDMSAPGQLGSPGLRQLAPLTGRSDAALSPDWRSVAYVSKKHIYRLALEGGPPERLTEDEGEYGSLNWSPDAQQLAFVSESETNTDVGVLRLADRKLTKIAMTEHDEDSPIWAPSSDRLAFIKRDLDWKGYEIWTSAPDGSASRSLVRETYERGVEEFHFDGNHHWSPDGSRIVYLSSRSGYNHLWTTPVADGEPVEITAGPYVDYTPRWSPSGERILFVSSRDGDLEERHLWAVDPSGGAPERLSPDGFSVAGAWSPDGSRVAYLRSSATEPPEVVVQDAQPGATVRRLTESRPDPAVTAGFVEPEAVRYPSRDGTEVPAILLRPRETAGGGAPPAILFFHGKGGINLKGWGGLSSYAFHQYLVQQGYAVLFVNWRGTHIGYGAEFERANYQDYGGGELDDVVAGARFLTEEVGVDPGRIACWGSSYGGYMTMLALTKAPAIFSAGISRVGVSDWASFLDESQQRLWKVRLLAKLGDPAENPELYERSAPIRFVEHVRAPLLITQGQDDDGVLPVQGESLYAALREAGKVTEYVTFIGEGHGFRHTGSLRDFYHRVDDFLREHNRPAEP